VDCAKLLRKIHGFPLTSWNYLDIDEKPVRHYGVMAQDSSMPSATTRWGTIRTPTTLSSGVMVGILMSAVRALDEENAAQKEQLAEFDACDRDARIARHEKMLPPAPAVQETKHRVASTREQ